MSNDAKIPLVRDRRSGFGSEALAVSVAIHLIVGLLALYYVVNRYVTPPAAKASEVFTAPSGRAGGAPRAKLAEVRLRSASAKATTPPRLTAKTADAAVAIADRAAPAVARPDFEAIDRSRSLATGRMGVPRGAFAARLDADGPATPGAGTGTGRGDGTGDGRGTGRGEGDGTGAGAVARPDAIPAFALPLPKTRRCSLYGRQLEFYNAHFYCMGLYNPEYAKIVGTELFSDAELRAIRRALPPGASYSERPVGPMNVNGSNQEAIDLMIFWNQFPSLTGTKSRDTVVIFSQFGDRFYFKETKEAGGGHYQYGVLPGASRPNAHHEGEFLDGGKVFFERDERKGRHTLSDLLKQKTGRTVLPRFIFVTCQYQPCKLYRELAEDTGGAVITVPRAELATGILRAQGEDSGAVKKPR